MRTFQFTKLFALLFAFSFVFTACEEDESMRGPKNLPDAAVENMGKPMDMEKKGAPAPGDENIVTIASTTEGFEILTAAVIKAGLAGVLSNEDENYTVFAPTNDAFEALGFTEEIIQNLDPEDDAETIELLTNVLLYHVTEGRRAAVSVVPPVMPRTIETLLEDATFDVNSDKTISAVGNDGTNIITADISASNGIIHVIDAVLLPIEL